MYYYLMEQPKTKYMIRTQEIIRDTLRDFGITGETVTVSPARTTEELVEMGLSKKYSTIVAVGSDKHINKIATYLQYSKCALGIIPISASMLIHQLIGTSDIKEACEILKYRKLKDVSLGLIEPNKYFITQIELQSFKPIETKITIMCTQTEGYYTTTPITELVVSRNLFVLLTDKTKGKGLFHSTLSWLSGKKKPDNEPSVLRGRRVKIETAEPHPITMDGEIVAKTPIVVSIRPRVLKVITKPARINEEIGKEKWKNKK